MLTLYNLYRTFRNKYLKRKLNLTFAIVYFFSFVYISHYRFYYYDADNIEGLLDNLCYWAQLLELGSYYDEMDLYGFFVSLVFPITMSLAYYLLYAAVYRVVISVLFTAFIVLYPVFLSTSVSVSFFFFMISAGMLDLDVFSSFKVANFFFFVFFFLYFYLLVLYDKKKIENSFVVFNFV